MIEKEYLLKLINLRKQLHKNPELSGNENETIKRIIDFIRPYHPDKIITELGKTGAAVIYNGSDKGNTVVIRCDLDALPIKEINSFDYISIKENVAHSCGHDGHMTIVAGLSKLFNEKKPKKGKVVLLFQPSEETGQGAKMILSDKKFLEIEPDYIYGFHNLPGFEKNKIFMANNYFSSASIGMIVNLSGETAHASEPEKGLSPALAIAELINNFSGLSSPDSIAKGTFTTIIHAKLGEKAFGTSPGNGLLMATLRSSAKDKFDKLTLNAENIVKKIAEKHKLNFSIEWTEEFPAILNISECNDFIAEAIKENNLFSDYLEKPFRWSEDFGFYTQVYKGAMFGIGSGIESPPLHSQNYDFPDDIITTGINFHYSLITKSL